MPDVRFDRYYRYEDLTRILQGYATACHERAGVVTAHMELPGGVERG